jgi:peptidoglycan hydrolase-like protein with peptidoglycan-binding domain
MSCYIIEPFFVDSKSDVSLYNKVGDEGIANAIVKGITSKSIIGVKSTIENSTHILKRGDSGEAVKLLQGMLNKIRFDCGIADGVFGNKTELAVKSFQQKYKIQVDGVVGPATLGKLKVLAK